MVSADPAEQSLAEAQQIAKGAVVGGAEGIFDRYRAGTAVWNARGKATMPGAHNSGYVLVSATCNGREAARCNESMQAFCRAGAEIPPVEIAMGGNVIFLRPACFVGDSPHEMNVRIST